MTRVTVAIVTYRSKAELPTCLESVLASDIPVKIVLIDNASGDGTLELARQYASRYSNVIAIDSGGNIGLAAGNNLVLPHIEGDYVLILNPDTVIEPDTLSALIALMERDPKIGVVGPMNVYEDGTPHTSYHHGWGFGHLILWRVASYSLMRRLYDKWAKYREGPVYYVSGACLLARARVFREVGGYDPAFFLTMEDTCDLCRRISERGYTILYAPGTRITHLTGRSGSQVPFLATLESYKGSIYYFRKFNGAWGGYLAFGIIVLACLTRIASGLLKLLVLRRRVDRDNLRLYCAILAKLFAGGTGIAYSQ
ncbi:MAG TPA: glycosyltransferase family 2 protein [Steroidobacteraceae bacterium]